MGRYREETQYKGHSFQHIGPGSIYRCALCDVVVDMLNFPSSIKTCQLKKYRRKRRKK